MKSIKNVASNNKSSFLKQVTLGYIREVLQCNFLSVRLMRSIEGFTSFQLLIFVGLELRKDLTGYHDFECF